MRKDHGIDLVVVAVRPFDIARQYKSNGISGIRNILAFIVFAMSWDIQKGMLYRDD